jgi:hypothetical protein
MNSLLKEFKQRRRVALEADHKEVTMRLVGLLDWMEGIKGISRLFKQLTIETAEFWETVKKDQRYGWSDVQPPQAGSSEEIVSVGWRAVEMARERKLPLHEVARYLGITGKGSYSSGDSSHSEAIIARYVVPFLDFVEERLPKNEEKVRMANGLVAEPPVIHDSLKRFHAANRNAGATCFVMMRFSSTAAHSKIETAIKKALKKHGLIGLLARDREFHDDLFPNILTYMHGCAFGVAVFERLETEEFNPNVALEVGYMLGLRKQVLLLKDQTLKALHTDLVGKLYREFDPQDPQASIPGQIDGWLSDKGIV